VPASTWCAETWKSWKTPGRVWSDPEKL